MLITNLHTIGSKLYNIRKKRGLTQAEAAEKAELSDRTYADIERGSVNMRVETLLKICIALNITPNEILTDNEDEAISEDVLLSAISRCSGKEKQTILELISVYLKSLNLQCSGGSSA